MPTHQTSSSIEQLTDDALLRQFSELLSDSRRTEAALVAHIREVEVRRLYAREGMPSMFAYCVRALRLSDHESYLRLAAARASRKYPLLLTMLEDGRLHLTGIGKLASHLTKENHEWVLSRATHRSKREIEELIAELAPKPDVPTTVRKLPTPRASKTTSSPPAPELDPDRIGTYSAKPKVGSQPPAQKDPPKRSARVEPLAPARYKIQFTAGAEFRDKLSKLQALMRSGDLAAVLEEAVTEKLERLEARRYGKTKKPRRTVDESDTSSGARYIAATLPLQ